MFFIFFIFSRNTIFGAAEQKCSAEHRLNNPGLEEEILFLLLFKKTKTRLIPIFELIKRYDLLQTSLINHFQMQLLKF
jgi:hypothetical protein